MSFNSNSLAQVKMVIKKSLEGYKNDLSKYIAYGHLRIENVESQEGVIPRLLTAESIANDATSSKTAKGVPANRGTWNLGSIQYKTDDFVFEFAADRADLEELTARQLDNISNMWNRGANQVLFDLDKELATIVSGDGLAANNQLVNSVSLPAGQEFNNFDSATSDPSGRIMLMVEATLGGDVCIMGRDVADALKRHPKVGDKPYTPGTSADRVMTDQALVDWLRSQHNMKEVVIDSTFYQDGASSFPLNPARTFGGVFYIGHKDNLILCSFKELSDHVYDEESTRSRVAQAYHTSTIVVQDAALGLALKNTLE